MVAYEVKAVRESVGVMDISSFAKVQVSGPDAAAFLDRLVPNRLPSKPGRIALTHLLNKRGRIEVETTIVRFNEDSFYLTCAAFFEQRLLDHLNQAIEAGEDVTVTNLSQPWALWLCKGRSPRHILAENTDAALDNKSFPWLRAQEITVAGHKVWALPHVLCWRAWL